MTESKLTLAAQALVKAYTAYENSHQHGVMPEAQCHWCAMRLLVSQLSDALPMVEPPQDSVVRYKHGVAWEYAARLAETDVWHKFGSSHWFSWDDILASANGEKIEVMLTRYPIVAAKSSRA